MQTAPNYYGLRLWMNKWSTWTNAPGEANLVKVECPSCKYRCYTTIEIQKCPKSCGAIVEKSKNEVKDV